MNDVAPAAFGVGYAYEFVHALAFFGDFSRGGGRTQGAVPGSAVLGTVDDTAAQQLLARRVEMAGRQEGCPGCL